MAWGTVAAYGTLVGIVETNAGILTAAVVLAAGILAGYALGRVGRRLLTAAGVDEAVEGTAFERTLRGLGTSTVALVSQLFAWFVYVVAAVGAFRIVGARETSAVVSALVAYLPNVLVAILVVIVGAVVGDKIELLVAERLRSVKFPPADLLPPAVRYTVIFLAALVALGHLGVATAALLVLLGGYLFAVVALAAVTFRDLLASGAAGVYLLLREPYGIGDEIVVGDRRGIVQEISPFVTHVESDDREYVVPNRRVFEEGVERVLDE